MRLFFKILSIIQSFLFLYFSSFAFSAGSIPSYEEESSQYWGETVIDVIEGEVTVYEFASIKGDIDVLELMCKDEIKEGVYVNKLFSKPPHNPYTFNKDHVIPQKFP